MLECRLFDRLVDQVLPGDIVALSGILRVNAVDETRLRLDPSCGFMLDVNAVVALSRTVEQPTSEDERSLFARFAAMPAVFPTLVASFCPRIHGQESVKGISEQSPIDSPKPESFWHSSAEAAHVPMKKSFLVGATFTACWSVALLTTITTVAHYCRRSWAWKERAACGCLASVRSRRLGVCKHVIDRRPVGGRAPRGRE